MDVDFFRNVLLLANGIYFIGPSLTIDGRTPLPISTDNTTALIALAYVVSILWMIFSPKTVIGGERALTTISLITLLGLFLPLPDNGLRTLIYIHTFSCCVMIGFETFVIVNYFTEQSAIKHLTIAYGVALLLITAVQNDFIPITFSTFRFLIIIALAALLVFFFKMPASKVACPQYVKKKDNITSPKKLLIGTYVLVFVGSLMAVSGPAISGEVQHGVFITYLVDAIASLLVYLMYKKANVHPFRSISICMGIGCTGFLLMFVSQYIPFFGVYFLCVYWHWYDFLSDVATLWRCSYEKLSISFSFSYNYRRSSCGCFGSGGYGGTVPNCP